MVFNMISIIRDVNSRFLIRGSFQASVKFKGLIGALACTIIGVTGYVYCSQKKGFSSADICPHPKEYTNFETPEELSYFDAHHLISSENGEAQKFGVYHYPNEDHIGKIVPFLESMEKGWIISTGKWRSFFDLILAPVQCEGLIVRDVNPEVRAFIEIEKLGFLLCNNVEEFQQFLMDIKEMPTEETLTRLLQKINETVSVTSEIKEYYSKNLELFLEQSSMKSREHAFVWQKPYWKDDFPNYYQCSKMFLKLKKYAKAGRIIATTGSMNDLDFLIKYPGVKPSIVDTSNIWEYSPLKMKFAEGCRPSLIFVSGFGRGAMSNGLKYRSLDWNPISEEDRALFDRVCQRPQERFYDRRPIEVFFYTQSCIPHAKKWFEENFVMVSEDRFVDLSDREALRNIASMPLEEKDVLRCDLRWNHHSILKFLDVSDASTVACFLENRVWYERCRRCAVGSSDFDARAMREQFLRLQKRSSGNLPEILERFIRENCNEE
jgi:hypothetical protein